MLEPRVGHGDVAGVLVAVEVDALAQAPHGFGEHLVWDRRSRRRARDHERHPRLVDQDEIGLVHDHVVEGPLDRLGRVDDQLVAEEIEARLLRGDIGDIGGVGGSPVVAAHSLGHGRRGETEEPIDRPHPCGVASGQVVVRREHVHAAPGERVERRGQDRNERLSLAGRHLREPPLVERGGGQHLDVERPESKDPRARLSPEREELRQEVVERPAVAGLRAERQRTRRQPGVGETVQTFGVDARQDSLVGAEVVVDREAAHPDERALEDDVGRGGVGHVPVVASGQWLVASPSRGTD